MFEQTQAFEARRPLTLPARVLRSLHLDAPLLLALLAVCAIGLGVLYSAVGQNASLVVSQSLRLGVALAALLVVAQIPPAALRNWAPWVFLAGIGLLLATLFFGEVGKGARRWLDLGIVRFQPSEVLKLAVPLMVAWYLHERALPPAFHHVLVILLAALAPAVLIAAQPDLGTAVLVASSGIFALLLAGLRLRYLFAAGVLALAALPVLWHFMLDYQRRRVLTFMNPESDPLGAGYNIIQSKIAIGSGGVFGKGWLNGTQAHLEFLPERATDFIFAVIGEEFGLLGLLALLALYLFIVGRGLYIAANAQDTFSRLLAGSLSLTFFVYVFVNAGMVSGLLPVVGVPLPLVSFGGTSMVTLMAGFGILMSIHTRRKLLAA
ncbi:MAG: rod shape-determining protein RodA [Gammaproteobacteria bacterium]|nr:MAG: rod shape-determining protein RodA [Gammaproteobacteria bacterium]